MWDRSILQKTMRGKRWQLVRAWGNLTSQVDLSRFPMVYVYFRTAPTTRSRINPRLLLLLYMIIIIEWPRMHLSDVHLLIFFKNLMKCASSPTTSTSHILSIICLLRSLNPILVPWNNSLSHIIFFRKLNYNGQKPLFLLLIPYKFYQMTKPT